jgi:beta-mannosidase
MAASPGEVELTTEVAGVSDTTTHTVAAGENRVEWHVRIANPDLWWPTGQGDQPLFDLRVTARTSDGSVSDRKLRRIGFRSTSMRDLILRVNSHRTFMRGVNIAPLALDMSAVSVEDMRAEVQAIRDSGFNMVRIRSHVTRHEFIDACDEFGVLVWQDLPLQGSYARSVTGQAEQQTRDMIDLLSHHPSIVVWGGHMRPHTSEPRTTAAPDLRKQQIPSWNRTVLDRAIRRTFTRYDASRTVIAHSDVAPHLPHLSGSDIGLYFGWFDGQASDIAEYAATLPRLVRFVSDMGAQALPSVLDEDLAELLDVQGSEVDALRAMVPPTTYPDVDSWATAMRAHQADVLKTTIESLRVLKYQPCGGFCAGTWRSTSPGLTRALLDADGAPRPAHIVATNALQPLLPVLYPATATIPARSTTALALYLCNDGVEDSWVNVVAMINDHRGQSTRTWEGIAPADDVVFLDDVSIRGGRIGTEVEVVLAVMNPATGETISTNRYVFLST